MTEYAIRIESGAGPADGAVLACLVDLDEARALVADPHWWPRLQYSRNLTLAIYTLTRLNEETDDHHH